MPPQPRKWESRRQDDRIATNADQAEFSAIRYAASNIEAGIFDDRVAGALDDYEVVDPRLADPPERWSWARDDAALDNAAGDIGLEVRRRSDTLGTAYPFEIQGNGLLYRPSRTLVYEFCLAVSQAPSLIEGEFARLPVAFERLVRDLLICFLGPGAQGLRTGWPPDAHEPRPPRFKQVIARLEDLTGEWIWSPEHGKPGDPDPQDVKDEGLDFVVWKEIPDHRPGRLFLLGQCACGNDYATKFGDIDPRLEKLSRWIRPISFAFPLRVFTTPRHIPNELFFGDINKQAGLTLDRTRITLLAQPELATQYVAQQAREPYAELIRLVIDGFRAARPARSKPPRKRGAAQHSQSRGTAA